MHANRREPVMASLSRATMLVDDEIRLRVEGDEFSEDDVELDDEDLELDEDDVDYDPDEDPDTGPPASGDGP
jgi:hypothetical protein